MAKDSQTPDSPANIISVMRKAALATLVTPTQHGFLVELPDKGEIMVTGDLHGNLANLRKIIRVADLRNHPQRHLVLQELVHDITSMDEVCRSHRLVEIAAKLKIMYPTQVHNLLGNHEYAEVLGIGIGKNGRELNAAFEEGLREAYGEKWEDVKNAFRGLWQSCPLAIRTANRLFISHSTPTLQNLDDLSLDFFRKASLAQVFQREGPVFPMLWDRDYSPETAKAVAERMDADVLIVGHTACPEGYRVPNDRHIIVDSKDFEARYVLLPLGQPLTLQQVVERVRRLYPQSNGDVSFQP